MDSMLVIFKLINTSNVFVLTRSIWIESYQLIGNLNSTNHGPCVIHRFKVKKLRIGQIGQSL